MRNNSSVTCESRVFTANELTQEMSTRVMPVTGFILFEAIFGLFGNVLIIIVYTKYYKRTNFRYFVLCLALIDLLSCCIALPAEAYAQMNWYTFEYDWVCKVKSYLNVFTIFASALTLMLLASDRYQKICHPFSWQIEPRFALRLCMISIAISGVVSIPTAIFWGIQSYDFHLDNLTIPVTICEKSDYYSDRIYPLIYISSAFCVPVFVILLLTVYFNITITWKIVCRSKRPAVRIVSRNMETNTTLDGGKSINRDNDITGLYDSKRGNIAADAEGSGLNDPIIQRKYFLQTNSKQNVIQLHEEVNAKSVNGLVCPKCSTAPKNNTLCKRCRADNCIDADKNRFNPMTETFQLTRIYDQSSNADINSTRSRCTETKVPVSKYLSLHKTEKSNSTGCIEEDNFSVEKQTSVHQLNEAVSKQDKHSVKLSKRQPLNRNLLNGQRKTLIMIILSSVFLLTLAIYFALVLLVANVDGILRNMSTSQTVVFFFFWRLYFANSAINPLLYGLMDQRFRQGLTNLCCR